MHPVLGGFGTFRLFVVFYEELLGWDLVILLCQGTGETGSLQLWLEGLWSCQMPD